MCRAAVTTAATYICFCFCCAAADPNAAATSTAPPVVRVPTFFFSADSTGCAACCDVTGRHCWSTLYTSTTVSTSFSHADRVFVIGDADCESSTIQPKRKESTICYAAACYCTSTSFQEVDRRDTRTATLTRLWSRGPCCCYYRCFYTFCCTSSSYFQEVVGRLFISVKSMLLYEYLFSGG